ncbi:uncharacterized protein LOC110677684 [Aedes aegypti]|uniref:Uncharacterized protein n=1 Tax=Aedes aegypti TaxID=7159 RepID=A0A6I8TY63_AEDAE|nr:uncharacterized protein LOC110677684 [Aedes aegypti]
MTLKCIAYKCNSTHNTKGMHFFRFPSVRSGKMMGRSKQRLHEWLKALGFRDSFNPKNKYICGQHFISGKAACLSDARNVDWIPSISIVKMNSEQSTDSNDLVVADSEVMTSPSFESFEGPLLDVSNLNSTVLPPNQSANNVSTAHDCSVLLHQADNVKAESIGDGRLIVDQNDYESFARGLLEEANLFSTALQNNNDLPMSLKFMDESVEEGMYSSTSKASFQLACSSESIRDASCVREHNYCKVKQPRFSSGLIILTPPFTSASHSNYDSTNTASTSHSFKVHSSTTNSTNASGDAEHENAIYENSDDLHCSELENLKEVQKHQDGIMKAYQIELARLQTKVGALEEELIKKQYGLDWINDDKRCRLFTGISSFRTLRTIYTYVENCLFQSHCTLTKDQMFIMTLRKLRRNTPFVDLAEEYSVCTTTISKYFHRTLFVLYGALKYALEPVSKDISIRHLPRIFKDKYGSRRIHIIDCFEVATEEPTDPKAALSHHSSYKMRETTKFMIAMSADGRVSFISHAYAGRCSDRKIAETSGFLDMLEPGDVVIADKGFDISDMISSRGAVLNIPTFLRKDSQLNPLHLENDKQITTLRVHVERIIGVLKSKYEYLNGIILVDSLRRFENNINAVDLAVWVCCILINFNKSIV